jgi:hypothetical protein
MLSSRESWVSEKYLFYEIRRVLRARDKGAISLVWSLPQRSPHHHPNVHPQSHLRLDSCRNSSNISESVEARDWRQQSPIVRDVQQIRTSCPEANSMEL